MNVVDIFGGHVLLIRCSDGFTTTPPSIQNKVVHEIRLPGGILFSDLCAQQFNKTLASRLLKRVVGRVLNGVMLFAIEVLNGLKKPTEIVLMAHKPCGAAITIGMTTEEFNRKHLEWQIRLQGKYPNIRVRLLLEIHSACGQHREPHCDFEDRKAA